MAPPADHVEQQIRRRLFREVNERIHDLSASFGAAERLELFCECNRHGCGERIEVPAGIYDGARRGPYRFVVRPGHEEPGDELVTADDADYRLVAPRLPGGSPGVRAVPEALPAS